MTNPKARSCCSAPCQLSSETHQVWGSHQLPGTCPRAAPLKRGKILQQYFPWWNLCPQPLAFSMCTSDMATHEVVADSKISPSLSFLQAEIQLYQPLLMSCASAHNHLIRTHSCMSMSFLCWGTPKWTRYFRCDLISTKQRWTNASLHMPAELLLMEPSMWLTLIAAALLQLCMGNCVRNLAKAGETVQPVFSLWKAIGKIYI